MLHKIYSLSKSQKGFTLVELLVAIAITSVVISTISITLSQIFSVSIADKNRMDAVKQVENALHYINRDSQSASAQLITPNDESIALFTTDLDLQWTDYTGTNAELNIVTYHLNANGDLQRIHTVGISPPVTTTVARYLDINASHYTFNGQILTVNLTATVSGYKPATELRTLQVEPRIR